jgi:hypothetical protein
VIRVVERQFPTVSRGICRILAARFSPPEGGGLLIDLFPSNIAPFGLTAGRGLHFPAYLSLILRIMFVPERSGWGMLVAGVGLLMVLYRRQS